MNKGYCIFLIKKQKGFLACAIAVLAVCLHFKMIGVLGIAGLSLILALVSVGYPLHKPLAQHYSGLPIEKNALWRTRYFTGLLEMLGVVTAALLLNGLLFADLFDSHWLNFLFFIASVLLESAVLYTMNALILSLCRRPADALIGLLGWPYFLTAASAAIQRFFALNLMVYPESTFRSLAELFNPAANLASLFSQAFAGMMRFPLMQEKPVMIIAVVHGAVMLGLLIARCIKTVPEMESESFSRSRLLYPILLHGIFIIEAMNILLQLMSAETRLSYLILRFVLISAIYWFLSKQFLPHQGNFFKTLTSWSASCALVLAAEFAFINFAAPSLDGYQAARLNPEMIYFQSGSYVMLQEEKNVGCPRYVELSTEESTQIKVRFEEEVKTYYSERGLFQLPKLELAEIYFYDNRYSDSFAFSKAENKQYLIDIFKTRGIGEDCLEALDY